MTVVWDLVIYFAGFGGGILFSMFGLLPLLKRRAIRRMTEQIEAMIGSPDMMVDIEAMATKYMEALKKPDFEIGGDPTDPSPSPWPNPPYDRK